jgi:hypothetical protein
MIFIRNLFTILAAVLEVTVLKVYVATNILERCSVRISAGTSAILTGLFVVLLSPLRPVPGTIWIMQRTLLSESLLTILRVAGT